MLSAGIVLYYTLARNSFVLYSRQEGWRATRLSCSQKSAARLLDQDVIINVILIIIKVILIGPLVLIIIIVISNSKRLVQMKARLKVGLTFYYGISFETGPELVRFPN